MLTLNRIGWFTAALPLAFAVLGQADQPQLSLLYGRLGLTDQQRAATEQGHRVANVVSWGRPSEVYVFGRRIGEWFGSLVQRSILRKIVVDKTRGSLEKGLATLKETLEHSATAK